MYCVIVKSVKSLLNRSQHMCDFTINNQSYPEGEIGRQHIEGALAAASVHMWSYPTPPDQYTQRPDHHTGNFVPYSFPQSYYEQGLWDGTYGLSSLSEKTRKSNHLQMLLQRQHFLFRYLKTLSVGPAGVGTVVRYSTNWADRSAVLSCIVSSKFWWGRHTKVPLVKALSDSCLRVLFSPGQASLTLHSCDNVPAE